MRCFYLVGYHGCGKTTQANLLQAEFPQYNYVGGKSGLDAVSSVKELIDLVKRSQSDMVIHGCIFQTEPTIMRLSRLTDLRVIVMNSKPETVKSRTLLRGASYYNIEKFKLHYRFVKKLPRMRLDYGFHLNIVDNNKAVNDVYKDLKQICAPS